MHTLRANNSLVLHFNSDWSGKVTLVDLSFPLGVKNATEYPADDFLKLSKLVVQEAADPDINESGEAPMPKVTVQQAAWIIQHFADNLNRPGSFRKVIYDRMGYGPEAYQPLYEAGGMCLTNAAVSLEDWDKVLKSATNHVGISITQDEHGVWKIETGDKSLCGTGKTLECAVDMFSIAVDKAASSDETATEES